MTESNSLQNIKNALRQLSPISLADLDRVALMNRVDTKYVISDAMLPDVLAAISSDYGVLEIDGVRCAPYATLYFDSPDADCYRDRKLKVVASCCKCNRAISGFINSQFHPSKIAE